MMTNEQKMARLAFSLVEEMTMKNEEQQQTYMRFSKKFPSLVHTCGLAQATLYGFLPENSAYFDNLATVAGFNDAEAMVEENRSANISNLDYQKQTLDVLAAATWLKRYSEALLKGDE